MSRDSIRQRVAAATEGPWEQDGDYAVYGFDHTRRRGRSLLATVYDYGNPDFIAHARQDIPALLAVADAAAAVLENHDAQRYLHRPDLRLFEERGGFLEAERLNAEERSRKEALRDALTALDELP